jgi:hypothetical protein
VDDAFKTLMNEISLITKEVKSATSSNRNSLIDSSILDLGFKNFLSSNSSQLCLDNTKSLSYLNSKIEESLKGVESAAENADSAEEAEPEQSDFGQEPEHETCEQPKETNDEEIKSEEIETKKTEEQTDRKDTEISVENDAFDNSDEIVALSEEIINETLSVSKKKQTSFLSFSFEFWKK